MVWGGNDNAVQKWVKQLNENDPKLTTLHILSMRRLSQDDLKSIFAALAHNTALKVLYCSGHALEQEAMDQLSEALTLNDTLETLNIGNAELGQHDDLLRIFGEGLAVNEGLHHLDLENKGLSDASLTALAPALAKNTTLRSLNLARNELKNAIEPLDTLRCLNLAGNKIDAAGARTLATRLAQLEELDVSNNPLMEGAGALTAALANNTALKSLKLMGVTALNSDNEEEDTADSIHGNALMQNLAEALKINRRLSRVWLDRNGIESQALESLSTTLAPSGLTELRLRNNRVDDQGAKWLAQASAHDRRVHLDLGGNAIGYEGFELLPELKTSAVESLDVGCNGITVDDLEAIVTVLLQEGVPQLRLLEMGGNAKEEETEAWEAAITRLQAEREELEVAWKRFMQEQQ
ncbi:hypothetical protein BDB00DRAFT_306423 [Zychaea mexicana]|uniref:uncharacterized protein n=1 Tax=Zychaea mexicana TaxID=64656 RepID=UPI0022FEAA25|nr:uncharacterized protein BDB00DRAFT_306423 [Zychaea mexicana]KAI9494501.1 hypothetical protein BDB00DRAFT_306423 [Zychaea mexicana]